MNINYARFDNDSTGEKEITDRDFTKINFTSSGLISRHPMKCKECGSIFKGFRTIKKCEEHKELEKLYSM